LVVAYTVYLSSNPKEKNPQWSNLAIAVAKEHLIACQCPFSRSGYRAIGAQNGHNVSEHHSAETKAFPVLHSGILRDKTSSVTTKNFCF
jgi:hypothetical protein